MVLAVLFGTYANISIEGHLKLKLCKKNYDGLFLNEY